jgi:glycosyltransferase involved in cell wall biosynthesis
MPVWNAEDYVEEAVHSALALPQSLEVLLVEDGSTDGSLAVCRRLAEESDRVRLLRHPGGQNRGPGESRNVGIWHAWGRYIAFLDADDRYLPNRFEVDVPLLEREGAVDGVYGAVATEFEEGYAPMAGGDREVTTLEAPVPAAELLAVLLEGVHGAMCTDGVTVRREVFRRAGLFDPDLRLAQDTAMWLKLAASCTLVAGSIEEPVAVRRRQPGNRATPENPLWRESACACLSSVLAWASREGIEREKLELLKDRLFRELAYRRLGRARGVRRLGLVLKRLARYGLRHPYLFARAARRLVIGTRRRLRHVLGAAPAVGAVPACKPERELAYWRRRRAEEGHLGGAHYEEFYSRGVGLEPSFYEGKRILDLGCGPRGSLEWAEMASVRVGLDPLAAEYLEFDVGAQEMDYVAGAAERMPFADASFDVVSSCNSLDHVDDVRESAEEVVRVLAPGGLFLLLVDVYRAPTVCEPHSLSWDVLRLFGPQMEVVEERHLRPASEGIYTAVRRGVPYGDAGPTGRPGVLLAKLRKKRD